MKELKELLNFSKRLEAWALRVRMRKLDRLMSDMASIETYIEYMRLREKYGNS